MKIEPHKFTGKWKFEFTRQSNERSDQCDCDIRDLAKKINSYEVDYDETNDKFIKVKLFIKVLVLPVDVS
jgi:hypothetical protein